MCFQRVIRPVLLLLCLCAFAVSVSANPVADLQKRLDDHHARLQKLQLEHKSALVKRASAEEKLEQAQRELADKTVQLAGMRVAAGANPSQEQLAFIDNETQRLSLAELTIKSNTAAVKRLQRSEEKLRDSITVTEKSIRDTERSIAHLRARQEADAREREELVQRRLQELQAENEQLRLAMEEEARRAQAAAEEAARMTELARQQEEARLALEAAKAATAQDAQTVMNLAAPSDKKAGAEVDLSQVVLEGEPPIYRDEDTINVVMRGRSLDKPVAFIPVGPNRYRAEVKLEPGRSFFDLRNRRYRGTFPGGETLPYVFYYDMNGEKPVLTVMHKSAEDQMISTAKDPF